MKRHLALGLAAASFLGMASVCPADIVKGFSGHWYVDVQTGYSLPFRLFTPQGYDADPDREYPLIVFLHGSGESGTNNTSQINGNIDNLIAHAKMSQYAAFILAPQTNSGWMTYGDELSEASGATMAVIDLVQEYFRVDPRRVYLTGLSMGGGGTWDLIGKRPNYFAAAVPICGYGDPSKAVNMVNQPIWAFHAANDGTVDVESTREMIAAVRAAGGDPLYTEYATGGHGIWGTVYNTNAMYDWMFSQELPLVPEPATTALVVSGLLTLLRRRRGRRAARSSRDQDRHRLRVEPLEDRRMLTAFVVNSLADTVADDGLTTLREALTAADTNAELWNGAVPAGSDTETDMIVFQPALFTDGTNPVPGTIVLAPDRGAFTMADPAGVNIQGPGAELLSIDANHLSRILTVGSGAQGSLSRLALVNGSASDMGGGISNSGSLFIAEATISGNHATHSEYGYGGAISNGGDLTLFDSILSDNSTAGAYGMGGAIYNYGALDIVDSSLSDNATAATDYGVGGAICNAGTLVIVGSTLAGNSTGTSGYGVGGAIYSYGIVSITDSILSGNSADGSEYGIGGAIYDSGTLTITGSTVSDNSASGYYLAYGGGVYSYGALSVTDSTVSRNFAIASQYYGYGGGVCGEGDLAITGSTISDNSTKGNYYADGGGIYSALALTITDSTVSGNTASSSNTNTDYDYGAYGGGVYGAGSLSIIASTISGNAATGSGNAYGGGVSGTDVLSIADSTISGNSTTASAYARGGGVHNAGTLAVTQSVVSGNSVKSSSYRAFGGGICNQGTLAVAESTVSANTVTNTGSSGSVPSGGGGVCNASGTTTIAQSVLSANSTTGTSCHGGGVFVGGGTVTVADSTLSDNYGYLGGGAYNEGTLTVRDSTLANNSAFAAAGLCNYRDCTIVDSTISGNRTTSPSGAAGGIANAVRSLPSRLTVANTTISGNSAGSGSGIYASGAKSTVSIANSTITANSNTASSGAIYVSGATVSMHNTVVAGNTTGDGSQISGKVSPNSSHNLIGVSTGLTGIAHGVNGNQIGGVGAPIDPMLGPLADNGGPTWTHAPLPGSPLIDAGSDARAVDTQGMPLRADQRGLLRRFGTVDIGAVEDQPPGVPLAYGDGGVVDQEASIVLDVLANDFCSGEDPLEVRLVEGPSHGTLGHNTDGTLTYTPDPAFWGVDSFSYQAVNGPWTSNVADVVVSVISPTSILVTTADDEIGGDGTGGDVSLREALEMAAPGSVIQFSADLLDQVIRLDASNGALDVSQVQIVGLGADHLTIDGCNGCRVIEASGTSLVSHVTITGGLNSGIYAGSSAVLTVADCVISGNTSYGGSGIYNNGGIVEVVDSLITNNRVNDYAFDGGGGILNRGTLTVTRSVISHNSARTTTTGVYAGNRGGGILNQGTLVLSDSTVSGNDAAYAGGGVANYGGTLTVNRCAFLDNTADSYGGGLDNNSSRGAAVSDSSFSGNVAATGGGAIAAAGGPTTVTRSILAGNSVTATSASGGAIHCTSGALTIVDSALSGNAAVQYGGGIYASSSQALLTIRNSTIAGNTAARGGGVANATGALIVNSIVALNQATTDTDFYGTLHANSGFNLIGVDPRFVRNPAPGDAKGDLRLRSDSPAINMGSNALAVHADGSPLLTDLGGGPRIVYATVDIGAYEYCMVADANYDGAVDTADATILAAHWGMSALVWADGDFNDDGRVGAADAAILAANWGAAFTPPGEQTPAEPVVSPEPQVLVGPVQVDRAGSGRRSGVRPVTDAAVMSDDAAHDVVLATEYGPRTESAGLGPSAFGRLAWSHVLARRARGR